MQFEYRTEPFRTALILTGLLLVSAMVVPFPLLRVVLLAIAAGPGGWALLQWRRRGRGVRFQVDDIEIHPSIAGRIRHIPYSAIQNQMITSKGQLVIAYQKPDKAPGASTAPHALTDIRPETHRAGPRYALLVTPAIAKQDDLIAALTTHVAQSSESRFTADDLKAWMGRRRMRNFILVMLAVLGTPLYFVLIGRIVASIQTIGMYTSGR